MLADGRWWAPCSQINWRCEMGTGQGKLPLDVVTDNALRKRKYEQDELEGAQPLMGITSSVGWKDDR